MKKWLVAAVLLYALPLLAQTYEWTDERGTVNFTEDLGRVPKKYRKSVRIIGDGSGSPQVTEEIESSKEKEKGAEPRGEKKQMYGGKDEKGWREEFGRINADVVAAERDVAELRGRLADTSGMSRNEYLTVQNSLKHAQYRVQELRNKLGALHDRADKLGVPPELRQ